jgi:hypothetical protein
MEEKPQENKENEKEVIDEIIKKTPQLSWMSFLKPIIIFFAIFLASLLLGLGFYLILFKLLKLKILLLKVFFNETITNIFSISFSVIFGALIGYIISESFYKNFSIFYKVILILSALALLATIIIWLFSYGPLKNFGHNISSFWNKASNQLSVFFCYINPENVASGDFEKCQKKDYKKMGEYNNLLISFEHRDFGGNPIPQAGKPYRLRFFLENQNVPGEEESFGKYVYDIKVKKIESIASSSDFNEENTNEENQMISYASSNKELTLYPGKTVPEVIEFKNLPAACRGFMYFKLIVSTEQQSRGKSDFLILPDYSYENFDDQLEVEIRKFKPDIIVSPGPIDVVVYSQPYVIKKEDLSDSFIQINIENKEEGIAKIKNVKLIIQRNYINVLKCEDGFGRNLDFSICESPEGHFCINFEIEKTLVKDDSYLISCKINLDESKYSRPSRESFVVTEVSYDFNYEKIYATQARGCIKQNNDINPIENENPTPAQFQCQSPNICYKRSCPEGYVQTSETCGGDEVCCRPAISNFDDCEDIADNCATGDVVYKKIACEAKKAGVPPDIMIGIAIQESGGRHCDENGNVKSGDGGRSIGLMQVSQCYDTGDVHNINENIRCAIKHIKEKCSYSKYKVIIENVGICDPTGYCTDPGVKCQYCYNIPGVEPKIYEGWDIAIRGYNGWGSCSNPANYNYVESVKYYASFTGRNYV